MKASLLGALWGLGHSTGQLILGLMMVILKDRFNSLVPALAKWGGTSVGLSLVCIGVMGLMELRAEAQAFQQEQVSRQSTAQNAQRNRMQSQPALATEGEQPILIRFAVHDAMTSVWGCKGAGFLDVPALPTHISGAHDVSPSTGASFGVADGYVSAAAHHESLTTVDGAVEKDFSVGTFITGVLYGLQPDALFVIVPALTLPTKLAAAGYCLMFVLGTVGAMGGYTAVIGAQPAHPE